MASHFDALQRLQTMRWEKLTFEQDLHFQFPSLFSGCICLLVLRDDVLDVLEKGED